MTTTRMFALATAALCLGLNAAEPSSAQSYPEKPIKIIVPAAPGSPNDFPARLAAQILTPKLGQPVVVENRPGAGGAIAAREVAKARPDGYTLLMGNTSTLAVIPAVSTNAGYDPVSNFTPIARITEGFQILVVHPSSPRTSIRELIDYARPTLASSTMRMSGLADYASGGRTVHVAQRHYLTGVSYRGGSGQ